MINESKTLRDILHIGRIIGAHGLKGELKILPLTDAPKRFLSLEDCLLVSDDETERVPAHAEGARFFNDQVLLTLKGVSDRTAAEKLKGYLVSVTRAARSLTVVTAIWASSRISSLVRCRMFMSWLRPARRTCCFRPGKPS